MLFRGDLMNKKAQTATEYLIILAVVVIIALIVVAVMGGIPGIGRGAGSRASASYWATQDVAISSFGISAASDDSITIKNNMRNSIILHDISINGQDLESSSTTLGVGGSNTYTGAVAACTAGQGYSYDVSITYEDSKTGLNSTLTGDGNKLEGTCAD
jgi:hypothetical protein